MKLTKPEHIGALQLIPGVVRTVAWLRERGGKATGRKELAGGLKCQVIADLIWQSRVKTNG